MEKEHISEFQKKYLQKPTKEFIADYDSEFINLMYFDLNLGIKKQDENLSIEYIYSKDYEIKILSRAYAYIMKYQWIHFRLLERYMDISKELYDKSKADKCIAINEGCQFKMIFLDRKLSELGQDIKISNVILKQKPTIIKNNLLIAGKKPNYSERYKIANDTLGLYVNINNRNISQTDKHILLAHILGCSQQVARELFNGTQQKRTPVREDMINKYLDTLN